MSHLSVWLSVPRLPSLPREQVFLRQQMSHPPSLALSLASDSCVSPRSLSRSGLRRRRPRHFSAPPRQRQPSGKLHRHRRETRSKQGLKEEDARIPVSDPGTKEGHSVPEDIRREHAIAPSKKTERLRCISVTFC